MRLKYGYYTSTYEKILCLIVHKNLARRKEMSFSTVVLLQPQQPRAYITYDHAKLPRIWNLASKQNSTTLRLNYY